MLMSAFFKRLSSVKDPKNILVSWILLFGAAIAVCLVILIFGGVKDYPRFAAVLGWAGLLYAALGVSYLLITPEKDSVWRFLFQISVLFVAFFAISLVNGKYIFLKVIVFWP
jgi:hypothetical protein